MPLLSSTLGPALAGGALIGLAATLLLWLSGRVAGISGITAGLFWRDAVERRWRLAFLAGLIGAAGVYAVTQGGLQTEFQARGWPLWIAGLLVGFGSRLGGGCTSGHGICGNARFSLRSLTATAVFMAAGMLTVWLLRHVL